MFEAVLFDLDGTLADTAPDLGGAANLLLLQEGRPEQPLAALRPHTSQGVRGMLRAGFGIENTHPDYERLAAAFLEIYAARLCDESRLFAGIPELLDRIENLNLDWGIVTNKRMRFTDPLVELLQLAPRTHCVVSGDTTAAAKPSPVPILHACSLLGCAPEKAIYVGDDQRDIIAGRAAGCMTVAAAWGYLGTGEPPTAWEADLIIEQPAQLAAYLSQRVRLK